LTKKKGGEDYTNKKSKGKRKKGGGGEENRKWSALYTEGELPIGKPWEVEQNPEIEKIPGKRKRRELGRGK